MHAPVGHALTTRMPRSGGRRAAAAAQRHCREERGVGARGHFGTFERCRDLARSDEFAN